AEVTDLRFLELERLDGAAVVGGRHRLDLHVQILLELGKNGRPAPCDLRRILRGQEGKGDLLRPGRAVLRGRGRPTQEDEARGKEGDGQTSQSHTSSFRWPPASRRSPPRPHPPPLPPIPP